ncbi:MAG: UPF0182 family protein [Promethearchaeota archaeon]
MSEKHKKHCPRHSRYYYRCNDCRKLNGLPPLDVDKVLYPDAYSEDEGRIERAIEREGPPVVRPPVRPSGPPKKPRRYSGGGYQPSSNRLKYTVIGLLVGFILTVIVLVIGLPIWHAGISLKQQLYSSKAGGFQYWNLYSLNYWSSRFFFNKTALIGAIIGVVVMIVPLPERGILNLVAMKLDRPPASRKFAYIFWCTAGFGIFYLLGQLIDAMGNFGWGMYLAQQGRVNHDSGLVARVLTVLTDPSSLTMQDIFGYQLLFLPIVNYVAVLVVLRLVSNIAHYFIVEENFVLGTAGILSVVGVVFTAIYLNLPTNAINGLDVIQFWSVLFGAIGFLAGGIFLYIFGRSTTQKTFRGKTRKATAFTGVAIIVVIFIPLVISVPTAININTEYNTWETQNWNKKIQKEIEWTRQCAGTDNFERRSVSNLTSMDQTQQDDLKSLQNFRAFDKYAAVRIMHPQVNRYEALGDSDIVYVGGQEYWVAPKTLKMDQIPSDSVNTHTMLYGHVEGFFAINTFTGELLSESSYPSIFGVEDTYPIFFGEHESSEYTSALSSITGEEASFTIGTGAFDPDILLNTTWATEIENYKYNYTGAPDGSLSGIEQFWYTTGLGLFAYAIDQENSSYLINRNIMTRVGDILYPYLWLDPDPYLVFDQSSGKMYYAVSICTDIPINSFAQSSILRFLGVCLVDVKTGELSFYRSPMMESAATSDPLYSFYDYYLTAYDWKPLPSWLKNQLRYPETLFEAQLHVDYTYHVGNPTTWKQGSDFYERPPSGDLFYVESNFGNGQEFIGIDIVEYVGREARVLAGTYVLRHGDNFGDVVFYKAETDELIGPQTARDVFTTAATNQLVLIENYRIGNTLLYPFHSSLFYFIPVYSSSSGTTFNLEQLRLAGLVNATDRSVGYGDSPMDAYNALNLTYEAQGADKYNLTWSYTTDHSVTLPNYATGSVSVEHEYGQYYYTSKHVVVNLTVLSNQSIVRTHGSQVTGYGYWDGTNNNYNFTVLDAATMYPGEAQSVTFEMTADVGGFTGALLSYYIVLICDGQIVETSPLQSLIVYRT